MSGSVPPAASATPTPLLLDHALAWALDHVAAPCGAATRWRFGPLVIVSPAEDAASAAVSAAAGARGLRLESSTVAVRAGHAFDREIAAALAADTGDRLAAELSTRRLVVVDRIDRIAAADRQQALVHLLDGAAAGGCVWVVSTPAHPATGGGSQCESRLCGGLVVSRAPHAPWRVSSGATPSIPRILRAAARLHDVQPAALVGPSRSRTVAAARSLAMYLARRLTSRSLQAIGAACGGRDHSTVLHGVRVCATRIARDPAFSAEVERLAAALGGVPGSGMSPADDRPPAVGSATLVRRLRGRRAGRRRLA